MSASERDWMSRDFDRPQEDHARQPWSITKCLIFINVAIFVLGMVWTMKVPPGTFGLFVRDEVGMPFLYGFYSEFACWRLEEYWRLLTYQFLHADMGHLVFNMIALYFFGGLTEKIMGKKRYLLFYLLCGISGALFSTLLASLGAYDGGISLDGYRLIPMVGASGSIYGLLVAAAFVFPKVKVQLLFPPIVLTMRTLALGLLGLGIALIIYGWENAGGEAGHIGGMLMGGMLILMPFFRGGSAKRRHESLSREVDRILEKISEQGMHSLTPEEREFMEKISRESRR